MGAGDVKLIAAVACIAGFGNISYLLIFTTLAGGVMGVGLALMHGQLRQTLHNVLVIVGHHRESGLTPHADLNVENSGTLRLPYGLAIAVGSMLTLCLQSAWRVKL
jgi:prepilin peptidase CpaA